MESVDTPAPPQGPQDAPKKTKPAAREVRVMLSGPLHRYVQIYRTLLGESMQEFLRAAVVRHIEAIGSLKLDVSSGGSQGVGIHVAGPGAPLTAMEAEAGRASPAKAAQPPPPKPEAVGDPQ